MFFRTDDDSYSTPDADFKDKMSHHDDTAMGRVAAPLLPCADVWFSRAEKSAKPESSSPVHFRLVIFQRKEIGYEVTDLLV